MNGRESTSHVGLGERSEKGDRVVEFANTLDLVMANTWFTKTRIQLITFKSGNSESQIDYYILTNRRSLKDIIKGALYRIQILCRRYTFWSYPAW